MSPYIACMNVICAWPAPSRAHEAVVVLRHTSKADHQPPSRPASQLLVEPEKKGNAHSGLVVPKPTHAAPQSLDEEEDDDEEDIVPREGLNRKGSGKHSPADATSSAAGKGQKKKGSWFGGVFGGGAPKEERVLKPYWRFVGFNDDPRVRALLEAHHTKLQSKRKSFTAPHRPSSALSNDSRSLASVGSSSSSMAAGDVQHGIAANHPTLQRLGTSVRGALPRFHGDDPGTPPLSSEHVSGDVSPLESPTLSGGDHFFTAPDPIQHRTKSPLAMEIKHDEVEERANSSGEVEDKPAMPPLARITTDVRNEAERTAKTDGLKEEDFKLADDLHRRLKGLGSKSKNGSRSGSTSEAATPAAASDWQSKLDDQLGPWRFDDAGTDMVEDNAFIFTNDSLSVPKRRKHFANTENREK